MRRCRWSRTSRAHGPADAADARQELQPAAAVESGASRESGARLPALRSGRVERAARSGVVTDGGSGLAVGRCGGWSSLVEDEAAS